MWWLSGLCWVVLWGFLGFGWFVGVYLYGFVVMDYLPQGRTGGSQEIYTHNLLTMTV